jgi:hypothetical protein
MELIMRSLAAVSLTIIFGYAGAAAASPLAWIGSVAVLLYSYLKAMKNLRKKQAEIDAVVSEPETLDSQAESFNINEER